MKHLLLQAALSAVVLGLPSGLALAADDHGHDHGDSAPTTGTPALPRFTAVSEMFELVGVLDGRHLTLYLDRADTNAPVTDAQIELEIAGAKVTPTLQGDTFAVELAAAPATGVLPITATVTAADEVDLLAGELDLHVAAAEAEAHAHRPIGWIVAGMAAVLAAAVAAAAWRRRTHARVGGAA